MTFEPLQLRPRLNGWPSQKFDVSPTGERFLTVEPADLTKLKVVLVQNWLTELERLVPTP